MELAADKKVMEMEETGPNKLDLKLEPKSIPIVDVDGQVNVYNLRFNYTIEVALINFRDIWCLTVM